MPCWYFERKEIKYSPSFNDGIDTVTENRYRREGARFIIDAGTRMGLRNDTCATGVVYFQRFYMFHSFKEFYRYVTAACCLLLAGKVEETPKKCRDIIRIAQSLLSASSFARFGEDPREEVMTMERVLLKTIKFDFQVEHPYSCLLKYAKLFKGDKEKTQKMVQMAWTFINDSLCTTLCLQWEPEIVSVSLMYLASRLTKFEPGDWSGRTSSKSKWWEDIIEGMSMELMEDVCHQVLDLYSSKQKKSAEPTDSPPQSPAKGKPQSSPPPPPPPDKTPSKRARESTPSESERPQKSSKLDGEGSLISTIQSKPSGAPIPVAQHITSTAAPTGYSATESDSAGGSNPGNARSKTSADYAAYNPYVSSQMFSASFMSAEGSQNIQSILAGTAPASGPPPPVVTSAPPPPVGYADPHHHHHGPPPDMPQFPPPDPQYAYPTPPPPGAPPMLDQPGYGYPPPPPQYTGMPPTSAAAPPPPSHYPPSVSGGPPPTFDPYLAPPTNPVAPYHSGGSYPPPSSAGQQHPYPPPSIPPPQGYTGPPYYPPSGPPPMQGMSHQPPPPQVSSYPPPSFPPQGGAQQQPPANHSRPQNFGGGGGGGQSRHRGNFQKMSKHNQGKEIPALTDIKISGRSDWGH